MQKRAEAEIRNLKIEDQEDIDRSFMSLISSMKYEIEHYKAAMTRAEQIIQSYEQENNFLKQQNSQLKQNIHNLQEQLRQLKWNSQKAISKSKQTQMQIKINQLDKKVELQEKIISSLESKLNMLNVKIEKQAEVQNIQKIATCNQTYSKLIYAGKNYERLRDKLKATNEKRLNNITEVHPTKLYGKSPSGRKSVGKSCSKLKQESEKKVRTKTETTTWLTMMTPKSSNNI